MDLPLFEQVDDLLHALTPDDLGQLHSRAHRRGVKVWFGSDSAPREHYEAQVLARRHVDGIDGVALEIGFHAEHRDTARNDAALQRLQRAEKSWQRVLGRRAELGSFYGAENWRRLSEAWIEPDLDDPELAFEIASRLVDYLSAVQPLIGPPEE